LEKELELRLHSLQLDKVYVEKLAGENKVAKFGKLPVERHAHTEVETSAKVLGTTDFEIRLRLKVTGKAPGRKSPFMKMDVTIVGVGKSSKKDLSGDDLESFAGASGPFLLWPYARMYLGQLSQQLGFPPFLLPTLEIPAKFTKSTETQDEVRASEKK